MSTRSHETTGQEVCTNSKARRGNNTSCDFEVLAQRREQLEGISAETFNETPDKQSHDEFSTMEDRGCGGKVEVATQPGSKEMKKVWVMF